jgi:hypothetical protein
VSSFHSGRSPSVIGNILKLPLVKYDTRHPNSANFLTAAYLIRNKLKLNRLLVYCAISVMSTANEIARRKEKVCENVCDPCNNGRHSECRFGSCDCKDKSHIE